MLPSPKSYRAVIERERADKELPAVSIALVDGDQIVWARGFGFRDAQEKTPATAATVYRVGSISKLFTDIAVMQLVERDQLDLDSPGDRLSPRIQTEQSFGKPITLRQLMSHSSGLVRESPVGNYFDPEEPSLAATVASLNDTTLVYRPGSRTKYSNAGIAVVGYVLEQKLNRPFAEIMREAILQPLAMSHSDFERTGAVDRELADAFMWTYDRRRFPRAQVRSRHVPRGKPLRQRDRSGQVCPGNLQPGAGGLRPDSPTENPRRNAQAAVAHRQSTEDGLGSGFHLGPLRRPRTRWARRCRLRLFDAVRRAAGAETRGDRRLRPRWHQRDRPSDSAARAPMVARSSSGTRRAQLARDRPRTTRISAATRRRVEEWCKHVDHR